MTTTSDYLRLLSVLLLTLKSTHIIDKTTSSLNLVPVIMYHWSLIIILPVACLLRASHVNVLLSFACCLYSLSPLATTRTRSPWLVLPAGTRYKFPLARLACILGDSGPGSIAVYVTQHCPTIVCLILPLSTLSIILSRPSACYVPPAKHVPDYYSPGYRDTPLEVIHWEIACRRLPTA